MRKLLAILPIVGLLVFGFGLTALAHSFTGSGDCDGWTLQLDGTWDAYDITVDGASIGLAQTVDVPDDSDSTSRTFVVKWWKANQPNVTRTVTVERTLECETTTTQPEVTTSTSTPTTTTSGPTTTLATTTTSPETSTSQPDDTSTTTTSPPSSTVPPSQPPTTDVCESEGTVPDSCLPPSTPPSPGPTLPYTGPNEGLGLAVSAFALLVLGGMVVLEGRR